MCILFGHMQLTYHSHHLIVLISLFVPTLQYLTLLALVHFSPMEHKQSTPIINVLSAGITCSALLNVIIMGPSVTLVVLLHHMTMEQQLLINATMDMC